MKGGEKQNQKENQWILAVKSMDERPGYVAPASRSSSESSTATARPERDVVVASVRGHGGHALTTMSENTEPGGASGIGLVAATVPDPGFEGPALSDGEGTSDSEAESEPEELAPKRGRQLNLKHWLRD